MEAALWIVTGLSFLSWVVSWSLFVRFRRVPAVPGGGHTVPRISIVIPARNEEANIKVLLKSLQGSRVHEIIVVDDQSEDRTEAVARELGDAVARAFDAGVRAMRNASGAPEDLPAALRPLLRDLKHAHLFARKSRRAIAV